MSKRPSKRGAPAAATTLADLKPDPTNARDHNERNIGMIADGIHEVGFSRSIVIDEDDIIRAGNGAHEAAIQAGLTKLQIVEADGDTVIAVRRRGLSEEQKRRLALYDNRATELSTWDREVLRAFESEDPAILRGIFEPDELTHLLESEARPGGDAADVEAAAKNLADEFGAPPVSVLDTRQGYWQERKRQWLSLGMESENGRKENMIGYSAGIMDRMKGKGTSIFDPVLCELMYRWFAPRAGLVLDPFAGGSVRGIVAVALGRRYVGIELRQEQIESNRAQAQAICRRGKWSQPRWVEGDSGQMAQLLDESLKADFILACPPYFDLEQYSDDPRDLSNMQWASFLQAYGAIIKASVDRLQEHRFACCVIGDVRDSGGRLRSLPAETVKAFEAAGARLYNDAVLINMIGSLSMRARRIFQARKLGRSHQDVLVFCKGDPRKATESVGAVEAIDWQDLQGAEA